MESLDLKEAAHFLKIHPVTLQAKARAGLIPAAKPGKCWAFLKDDLVTYLRSLYSSNWRTLQGDNMENSLCHFTSEKTHPCGGLDLPIRDAEYNAALALQTNRRRKSTKQS